MRSFVDRWAARRFLSRITRMYPTSDSMAIEAWLWEKAGKPDVAKRCWDSSRSLRDVEEHFVHPAHPHGDHITAARRRYTGRQHRDSS